MLSIRMTRTGKKKRPHFRIIVQDKRRDPWAKAIEILGHRDPRTKETVINKERLDYWLSQGAKVTDSVWNILVENKFVKGDKRGISNISKKRKVKIEEKDKAKKEKEAEAKEKEQAKAPAEEAPAEKAKEEAPAEETKA